ncbi:MAG TPA: acyltransferase [Chloroflexota bacterium]|nr:acyltransferase [Chloroflexota bacterium]
MGRRILGLDALRFLCALCVVQGHLRLSGYLILDHLHGPTSLVYWVRVVVNQGIPIPNGPNAVIVFFVISGFCIHYPYRNEKKLNVRQFMVRRYVRVGVPAVVAGFFLYRTGFHSLQDSVLWSVLCEMIYYSIYPLLMSLKHRFGWRWLIAGSFLLAYAVVASQMGGPYNGDFPSLGAGLTWILGLPCWLLGCLLAEKQAKFRVHGPKAQWLFRCGIVLASFIGTTLRFHQGIGYYWSEPALGILIYFWLGTEIAYYTVRKPWKWLEWCGSWSYSIYLFHAPIAIYVGNMLKSTLSKSPLLLVELASLLVGCYLVYRLVERPAHLMARRYRGGGGGRAATASAA